jgi:trehalose 6-phosphate phosphatase
VSDVSEPIEWDGLGNVLAQFSRSNVLLAFDFDGTLAPIVDHPRDAVLRDETRALLRRLSQLYPCAVISGRGGGDVRERLDGTGIDVVVGNHGADLAPTDDGLRRRIAEWKALLTQDLADLEGVWVEDKVLSLTVHYRNSPYGPEAKRRVGRTLLTLEGAKAVSAKQAVNIVAVSSPDKGVALEIERRRLRCERVIFVGDDQTDEDVFSREWSGILLGVSIGRRKSAAHYQLRGQLEIDRFLRLLAELREPPKCCAAD